VEAGGALSGFPPPTITTVPGALVGAGCGGGAGGGATGGEASAGRTGVESGGGACGAPEVTTSAVRPPTTATGAWSRSIPRFTSATDIVSTRLTVSKAGLPISIGSIGPQAALTDLATVTSVAVNRTSKAAHPVFALGFGIPDESTGGSGFTGL
jgi:hypothetical protein